MLSRLFLGALAAAALVPAGAQASGLCPILRAARAARARNFAELRGAPDAARGGWRAVLPAEAEGADCVVRAAAGAPARLACVLKGAALASADAEVRACLPGWRDVEVPDTPTPRRLYWRSGEVTVMLAPAGGSGLELRAW